MTPPRRRFRFIKEIAEGGFGKVYLAEQLSSDGFSRIVAIKLLHAKWSSHDEVVMRTRDEARLLGLIRHQHIVKVEDLTSIDGKCALVMEYLEGVDLKWMMTYLQDRSMHFPRAALFEIILATASALDAAYNGLPLQGNEPLKVIHRDIKPSNIFVTVGGGVKVLDFGTARANFAEREAKTQALAFGSQGYMAPERMLGEEDTPAADVFSLGVTLYELLALDGFGRIPPRPNKFLQKVEEKVAAVPLEGDPEWCARVRETLRLMLAYEPGERPTAAQLVDIFEALAQDARDTGLRKFCRSLVTEAKAAEPVVDTGDALAGATVTEDISNAYGVGAGGAPMAGTLPEVDQTAADAFGSVPPPPPADPVSWAPVPPPEADEATVYSPRDAAVAAERRPEPAQNAAARTPTQRSIPPTTSGSAEEPEAPSGGGGFLKWVVAGGFFVAVVGLVLVVGLLVVAYFATQGGSVTPSPGGSTPAPGVADTKPPEKDPGSGGGPTIKGSKVLGTDDRKDVERSPTTLTWPDPKGADITIQGGVGFKAEWDGKAEFALGELAAGSYRTNVTPPGGKKLRNKSFEVEGKKTCAFTFDTAKEEWVGGCK